LENFEKIYVNGIVVLGVNLTRAILNDAVDFRKIIEEEISSGQTQLVIDLSRCDYIDSTFFGAIIIASKKMINLGYKLKVVKPAVVGESIFIHTKTPKIFDKFKTREEAIKSF